MQEPLAALQSRLGHTFREVRLLQQALTHRSFSSDHNERPEGDLSRVRANLVKQDTLHQLALSLELPGLLRLGEGELRSGGAKRASILADALEALLGAVYLDGGAEAAHQLVQHLFSQVDIRPDMQAASKDPKTELQEWLQARKMMLPRYTVIATHGAAHRQTFDVACEVQELRQYERGTGASRRAAEQAAAAALLQTLKAGAKP